MHKYLEETPLLDATHPTLVELVHARGWKELEPFDAIGAI